MCQRLENVLQEFYSKELISYIIGIEKNFKNIIEKLDKLKTIENTDDFNGLITILKRMKNIVKDNKCIDVNENLFTDEYEKAMFNLYIKLKDKSFSDIVDILTTNSSIINSYFDNVKINVSDEDIRNNRLALLSNILNICANVIRI